MRKYIYVSVDIEADGKIPSQSNLMSIGAAKVDPESLLVYDTFHINLLPREDAVPDPDTMEWWSKYPNALKAATIGAVEPLEAMQKFRDWLLGPRPVFVGYPATYDFMWVYDYFIRYLGECPFGFSGLDIKTLAMTVMDVPYPQAVKRRMPREWFRGTGKHSHLAVQDAVEQAMLFAAIMKEIGDG